MSPKTSWLQKRLTIYVLIIISISFLTIPENISNHIKVTIASPLAPVQKIISQTVNFLKNGFRKIASITESDNEKKKLEEKKFFLQNKIVEQQNTISVLISKLEAVSEFKKNIPNNEKPIIANVIGYDVSNFRRSILIDVGKKQGVSVDNVVVFGSALVGRISSTGNSSSRVMLITDPASNVPSRFLKSRAKGMIQGTAGNTCIIKYIPRQVKVEEGNKVISSGIGGVFPKSIYIGDVVEVREKSAKLFKDVKLKPRIDFSEIEHVLVIKKRKT